MPQASDELRAEWCNGDPIGGELEACQHLKIIGFTEPADNRWHWRRPSPDYVLTPRDISAITFLIDEWDYGGLVD